MDLSPFALERYFDKYEFSTRYLLSCSDCEALSLKDLLDGADPESLRLWENLTLGYTESPGHPVLRECIAELYEGIATDQVMVAVPEECIFLYMHALLEAGDHMICTYPNYQSLTEIASSLGCEISAWEADEDAGWRFSLEGLKGQIRDNTRLIVVNFPHNPTGAMITPAEFRELAALASSRGIRLFSDEMYRYLTVGDTGVLPAACELSDTAVSFCGLSKCFGLPGLRVGWLATGDKKVLERARMLKDYTTICNSAPGEILAIMALRDRERLVARAQAVLDENIRVLDTFFDEFKDCLTWHRPLGGSVCLARMTVDTFAFCEQMVQDSGIMLLPSRMFQFGDRHVRIGFGRKNMPGVLDRFKAYLTAQFN